MLLQAAPVGHALSTTSSSSSCNCNRARPPVVAVALVALVGMVASEGEGERAGGHKERNKNMWPESDSASTQGVALELYDKNQSVICLPCVANNCIIFANATSVFLLAIPDQIIGHGTRAEHATNGRTRSPTGRRTRTPGFRVLGPEISGWVSSARPLGAR